MVAMFAFATSAWRIRNDDGTETTATWQENQNTNPTNNAVDVNFRVRFRGGDTGGASGTWTTPQLQYQLNTGGWNNVNVSSTVVRSSASANFTDNVATTSQLTGGGGGTFVAGTMDEVDGVVASISLGASGNSEVEFCVQIRSADVVNNDTVELRVLNGGAAPTETNGHPSLTVVESTAVTGSLAVTQDPQTLAASGTLGLTGSLAVTQAAQTLAASGTVDVALSWRLLDTDVTANRAGSNFELDASGAEAGELLLIFTDVWDGTDAPISTPTDFTIVTSQLFAGNFERAAVFAKVATGSETTISFSTSDANDAFAALVAVTGATPTVDDQGSDGSTATVAPSVTATADGSLLLCYWYRNAGSITLTPPDGMTSVLGGTNNQQGRSRNIGVETVDSGATGTRTATASSGTSGIASSLVISEEAGGTTGSLAQTQDDQTLAASGTVTPPSVTGSLSQTQDAQTLSASGTVTSPSITGTLDQTQDNQTLSAAGALGLTGSLAVTQADQTLAASGAVGEVTVGTLAETQDDNTLAASGHITHAAALAQTQDDQTLTASGIVGQVEPPAYMSIVVGPMREPVLVDIMRDPLAAASIDTADPAAVGELRDTTPTVGQLRDDTTPTVGVLRDPLEVDTMRDPITVDELRE